MDIIQDLMVTNNMVMKKATKAFRKNPIFFFLGILYAFATLISITVARPFGIFGGMVVFAAQAAIISDYLYVLDIAIHGNKFTIDDLKVGYRVYFRQVYSILFLIYVVNLVVDFFIARVFLSLGLGFVVLAIKLFLILLLNAIPETIYQKHRHGRDTVVYAYEFLKENVSSWIIPNVIIWGVLYLINMSVVRLTFSLGMGSLNLVIMGIVGSGIVGFGMIYRGFLFQILSSTTKRKRMFMRNINK